MAAPPASSSSSPPIRSWRTGFLTLRDETLTTTSSTTVLRLLHQLIFSQSEILIAAAPHLPPHEVTSDVLFLMDLIRSSSDLVEANDDIVHTFTQLTYLAHTTSRSGCFEFSSSSWALVLDFFGKMVEIFLGKTSRKRVFARNAAVNKAIKQCLEIIRLLSNLYQRTCSVSDNVQLLNFLLIVAACSDGEIYKSSLSSGNQKSAEFGKRAPGHGIFWENQIIAFSMIGEVFSRVSSSFSTDVWQSTIENLRKVMDMLASRGHLAEDNVMARFYTSFLNCLHLVLTEPKGSLSDHVTGFVAALSMFINYGITSKLQIAFAVADHEKELNTVSLNVNLSESNKPENGPYRPPHLRRRERKNMHSNSQETSRVDSASSDSDYSDSDVSANNTYISHCSKARVAAITCIQDLCQADPKLFTSQWTLLLPSSDVLHMSLSNELVYRKYQANLLSCLLFDPHLKARIASASALATMLDGPASVFLQVAEYKESSKSGSFTALSSSLGQILMQLHSGVLYLIQRENHSGLLVSLFKVFMLLISSTPYSRMPGELLPTVISSLCTRIEVGFPSRSDQTGLLAVAFNCLTTALSASSSAFTVREMFSMEVSTGCVNAEGKSGVLQTILRYSELVISPTISFEALQALRAVAHNCPDVMVGCWKQISFNVYGFLKPAEVPARSWKGSSGGNTGALGEKVTTAAIKVLDECLRAISGFKGTEDLIDDKFLDNPFASDYVKTKTISSAPSYGSDPGVTLDESDKSQSGSEQWCEALEKHMPLILGHTSAMVRAASVTCFAGITSSVFFSLPKEKQHFVITSSINAAVNDEVPSVRSAGCRAVGVIACFPKIFNSAEILDKFILAAEINTRNPLVSVRVTASWALANLCDSLRHCVNANTSEGHSIDSRASSGVISLLIDCAMQLTKDGDKVKANAVRALGNLSRFVIFPTKSDIGEKMDGIQLSPLSNGGKSLSTSHDLRASHRKSQASNSVQDTSLEDSRILERMVQAFLSCVTTGNVKVQWNVCHALSNLFLNETLDMQVMDWAPSVFSILLLLLRDSSNFKIRIQAAAALAVPGSIRDYGRSFADVIQGVEHILESFNSDHISAPSSFKYRVALEKQLTATMLHMLALASSNDYQPVKDFLVKKASFLEEWLKVLCFSVGETIDHHEALNSNTDAINQKKDAISKAVKSLIEVYESRNHHVTAARLNKLTSSIQ